MCLKKYKQLKNKYISISRRIYCIFDVSMNENFFRVQPNQCLQIAILRKVYKIKMQKLYKNNGNDFEEAILKIRCFTSAE